MDENMSRKQGTASGNGNLRKKGSGLGTGPVGQGGRTEGTHSSGTGKKTGSGSTRPGSAHSGSGYTGSSPKSGRNAGGDDRGLDIGTIASVAGSVLGSGSSSGGSKKSGGGLSKILIIVLALALLGGGGGFLGFCSGGNNDPAPTEAPQQTSGLSSILSGLGISNLLSGTGTGSSGYSLFDTSGESIVSNDWGQDDNTGVLDTDVVSGARDKRTVIKGNNKDVVTIMVYMCGTDLESQYGMATNDLNEMKAANLPSNVNLVIYTGGCKRWKTSEVSASTNQIHEIVNHELNTVSRDEGAKVMTDPNTLAGFIQYCKKQYPANRYELIFWDHGGGSVSGYGYDEKYSSKGSMSLTNIDKALKAGGATFDFIGFDACLMATADTAMALEPYADYMIASEESEPGIGWYYTDWLNQLGKNTSTDTLSIGKTICDTFVSTCARECRGQATTLSVVDLAEFSATVPKKLTGFWTDLSEMVSDGEYATVATARAASHEFASSSKIDQVDLIHFAKNLGTKEADALEDALLGAIKYNKTSAGLTNAYGLSIYFPKNRTSYASTASSIYSSVSADSSYQKLLSNYTSTQVSGQIASGGTSNYGSSLTGLLGGGSNAGSEYTSGSSSLISDLLSAYIGSGTGSSGGVLDIGSIISGLTGGRAAFLEDRDITTDEIAAQLAGNLFDDQALNWKGTQGNYYISLSKEQWSLVTELLLSMYYDDGEGYIDLGLDNMFTFNQDGTLAAPKKATWLSIDGQGVAYYYESMVSDGKHYTINGWVPAYLNGELVHLMLVFDNETPYGRVTGAIPVYGEEIEVQAKNLTELVPGDVLEFVCDYYSYEGEYLDSYLLGDEVIVGADGLKVGTFELEAGTANMMYRFKDIYNVQHWSEVMTN